MELLNGKAKELFIDYCVINKDIIFNRLLGDETDVLDEWDYLSDLCKNALIIDWLDSIGVYVWTMPSLRVETKWTYRVFKSVFSENIKQRAYVFNTRPEATTEAIKKANELINQTL
jgi:hypothetical protein